MSDTVTWLRDIAFSIENGCPLQPSAERLKQVAAEIGELRKALDLIQSTTHWRSKPPHTENDQECMYCNASKHRKTCPISIARQALQTKDTDDVPDIGRHG